MVPNLSPQNLAAIEICKDFMFSHGYISNDFDVHEWAAPEFLERAATELLEEQWKKTHHHQAARDVRAPEATDQPGSAREVTAMTTAFTTTNRRRAGAGGQLTQIENVAPRKAFEEISTGQAVALDVREPVEWENHIEGSVQVPRGLLEFAADPASPRHKSPSSTRPGG